MAITEETLSDKIEIVNLDAGFPVVQVRTIKITSRDGQEVSRTFHRHTLAPTADLSLENDDVSNIAATVFTDEAKAAYNSAIEEIA
jgi:hypothetical protein